MLKEWRPRGIRGSVHGMQHDFYMVVRRRICTGKDVRCRHFRWLVTRDCGIYVPGSRNVNFSCCKIRRLTEPTGLEPKEGTLVSMTETWFCVDHIPGMDS